MMPLKSITLMLLMQLTDALIILNGPRNVICLSIANLFNFSQMAHIHLVSHLLVDYLSACGINH